MQDTLLSIQDLLSQFIKNAPLLFILTGIAWGIHLLNTVLGRRLCLLGILPRRWFGLPGIVCSPWLHGNWGHLIMNSFMFLILGSFMMIHGRPCFIIASITIILLSGLLVWLFGRSSLHIGASGLIMGYWGYLLASAYAQPTFLNIFITVICLFYLSGLFNNLVPQDKKVSWEGHAFGFISGIMTSFLYPYLAKMLLTQTLINQ